MLIKGESFVVSDYQTRKEYELFIRWFSIMTEPVNGLGAFVFPFITVADSDTTLKELPPTKNQNWVRKIALNYEVPSFRVLVTDDGFIGIASEDTETVRKYLNLVCARLLIDLIVRARIIIERDLCKFSWKSEDDVIEITQMKPTPRNHIAFERDLASTAHKLNLFERKLVTPTDMKELLMTAYSYNENPELANDLILIEEGWTLLYNESPRASFLYSWMLIEGFIEKIWDQYIDTLDRSSKDKDELKSSRNWTAYHHIEILSLIGKMNKEARDLITTLRKKRNNIIHEKEKVSNEVASICLATALRIILNPLEGKDPFWSIGKPTSPELKDAI